MNELNFKITLDEANILLNALTKQPFEIVAQLIKKIQLQATEQIEEAHIEQDK